MEKPASMSLKEWLIKKIAIKLVISEKIINEIITHQFDSANDALETCKSIEIAGFGRFIFNQKKANTQMAKLLSQKSMYEKMLLNEEISLLKRNNTEVRLRNTDLNIKFLINKIT